MFKCHSLVLIVLDADSTFPDEIYKIDVCIPILNKKFYGRGVDAFTADCINPKCEWKYRVFRSGCVESFKEPPEPTVRSFLAMHY